MSAQINSINDLITRTMTAKAAAAQDEAARSAAAKDAARKVLATYIENRLPDVLRLLNLTLDDFQFVYRFQQWESSVRWEQEIQDKKYPMTMTVFPGQVVVSLEGATRSVHHAYLKPGPQDPVDALGQFLIDVPVRWREYQEREGDRALDNLTKRLNRASDIDALLAIAAAADEDELLRPEDRAGLRTEIAKEICTIRNEERAERAHRNARLIYAIEIIELAQAYVEEYAYYQLACFDWATAWTRELWEPGELYKVRYGPVTADGATDYAIQELVILENPSTVEWGDWNRAVTEVTRQGQIAKRWIGAFLDAKPMRWDEPLITDRYMYHTSLRAGDYYVNIPPATLAPVDVDAVEAARPTPPDRWVDWLRERYSSPWQIDVPAAIYPSYPAPLDAFDVARMTPAEFVDSPKINI